MDLDYIYMCVSKGKVMAAMSENILKPPLVEILELLAARHVVKFYCRDKFQPSNH